MSESENNIPTLTEITHPGKHEMLNHFDGHQFEDETKTPFSFENASELENTGDLDSASVIEYTDINDIPSITIDNENANDIASEDFTDALQSVSKSTAKSAANSASNKKLEDKKLKAKIDQAISEALPGIEAQLKGKLYTKFGI